MQEAIRTLALFFRRIVEEKDEIPTEVRRRFILQLVGQLESKLETELLEVRDFAKAMGVSLSNFVTFDGSLGAVAELVGI